MADWGQFDRLKDSLNITKHSTLSNRIKIVLRSEICNIIIEILLSMNGEERNHLEPVTKTLLRAE